MLGGGGVMWKSDLAIAHLSMFRIMLQVSYFNINDWIWVTGIGDSYRKLYFIYASN